VELTLVIVCSLNVCRLEYISNATITVVFVYICVVGRVILYFVAYFTVIKTEITNGKYSIYYTRKECEPTHTQKTKTIFSNIENQTQ